MMCGASWDHQPHGNCEGRNPSPPCPDCGHPDGDYGDGFCHWLVGAYERCRCMWEAHQ